MANFDDLLFEHRNQAYGAYTLRQGYRPTLTRALMLGSLLFVGALQLPSLYALVTPSHDTFTDEIRLIPIQTEAPPEEKVVIPPKAEPAPTVATVRNPVPEVVADAPDDVPPPIATVDELKNAASGPTTQEGDGISEVIAPPESSAPSAVAKAMEVPEKENDEPFVKVEQDPEFPGGTTGLGAYLQRNLRYPSAASNASVSGKVYVSFTVNTDGSLADVQVLKGIGFGCDEEAIRVLKTMPRWKAGRQGGRAVRVKFNLPITFTLD